MRVALVHDWLVGMRGGERVLQEMCRLFPLATIFTLFHKSGSVSPTIESMPIRTSVLNGIPGAHRYYRLLLPLFPWAVSRLDLNEFDLILSISHAAAKGIRKPGGSLHVCYCLTPMRYIWDMKKDYFDYNDPFRIKRAALQAMLYPLRTWDRDTAAAVDHFIADSRHVQRRIQRCYGRTSDVIYPPVDTEYFTPITDKDGAGYFLVVSALVPYKRVDIAIEAFNRLGYPLVIAGTGPDLHILKAGAGRNISFEGYVSDERLRQLYRHCRAVVITAREDFGLVSLEAQACGRPPVAYGSGGSLESIIDGETGILYGTQTADDLAAAIRRFESTRFDPELLRKNAERFSTATFRSALMRCLRDNGWEPHSAGADQHPVRATVAERGQSVPTEHTSLRGFSGMAKRCLDVMLSLSGLIAFGLPLLFVAFVISRSSDGPGFFCQTRVGLRRRTFRMVKLRTMYNDAERSRGPIWAVSDDPRCTPLGGFLRKYGLDELPQLWNVLCGDMSLIGPRPERPEFQSIFEERIPGFGRRLEVRGGISGLAQVRGWRGDTSLEQRLRSDLEYIENWSFWMDLLILVRTPFFLLRQNRQRQILPRLAQTVSDPTPIEGSGN